MSLDTQKKRGKELQGTEEKQNANPLILGGIYHFTFYKPGNASAEKESLIDQSPGGDWIQRHQENFRLATTLQVLQQRNFNPVSSDRYHQLGRRAAIIRHAKGCSWSGSNSQNRH